MVGAANGSHDTRENINMNTRGQMTDAQLEKQKSSGMTDEVNMNTLSSGKENRCAT